MPRIYSRWGNNYEHRRDAIDKTSNATIFVGSLAIGATIVDVGATAFDAATLDTEQYRAEASRTMNVWIDGIEDNINRHPNEIAICRTNPGCTEREMYDLTNYQGLSRYITDEVSVSGSLDATQKEAMQSAVVNGTGPRLQELDQQQTAALRDAATTTAATYPDRVPVTTYEYTGELFMTGVALIVATIAGRHVLKKRQAKQIKRYKETAEAIVSTRNDLFARRKQGQLDSDQQEQDFSILNHIVITDDDRFHEIRYGYRYALNKLSQPCGGGKRARQKRVAETKEFLEPEVMNESQITAA
jgi:hypothetical protein